MKLTIFIFGHASRECFFCAYDPKVAEVLTVACRVRHTEPFTAAVAIAVINGNASLVLIPCANPPFLLHYQPLSRLVGGVVITVVIEESIPAVVK
jgi:hypothetical protein